MKRRVLIAVLALTVVTIGVLLAWQVTKEESPAQSQVTSSKQNTSDSPNTKYDATENGKYIVVKEWGIKLGNDDIRGSQMTYLIDDRESIAADQRDTFIAFFDKSAAPYIAQLSEPNLQKAKECVSYAKGAGLVRNTKEKQKQAEADEYYVPVPIYAELNNYVYLANISNALCPVLYEANLDPSLKLVLEKYYSFPQPEGIAAFARSARPID